jgi:hypothetical protein
MNNNNLKSLINLYGGNDDPNKYTSSLLSKYTMTLDKTIIKINNLESLLIDNDSNSELENIFSKNSIIKIDNLNNITTEDSENFKDFVSKNLIYN